MSTAAGRRRVARIEAIDDACLVVERLDTSEETLTCVVNNGSKVQELARVRVRSPKPQTIPPTPTPTFLREC